MRMSPIALVAALDQPFALHPLESLRQQVRGYARETPQQLGVALRAEQQVADDEQRPPFAEDVERAGEAAVLVVGASGHE